MVTQKEKHEVEKSLLAAKFAKDTLSKELQCFYDDKNKNLITKIQSVYAEINYNETELLSIDINYNNTATTNLK